ncbi:MAG: DUF1549 and DUF1553 domain-containing protein [Gemmatales bacterium]|nr:DUF1549 and DUF1553 domain-containing protein [Gemmatales bacterium]MDW7995654.1 DUF1549 and DUF1553 domain-containing protein [Gemmatales bacterium]
MRKLLFGRLYTAVILVLVVEQAISAEYHALPEKIELFGPHDRQRVIVVSVENGQVTADKTSVARFAVVPPAIAQVDEGGLVWPKQNGQAILHISMSNGPTLQVPIQVRGMDTPAPSFRNDVLPMLTRAGCNSGACHGALAGKGGLKLSLRGYDPEADYFVLTRQALGRRVDLAQPHRSLLLLKPTMTVNHGGGLRIDLDSPEYLLLADWLISGAPGPQPNDASVVQIEVLPKQVILRPGEKFQLLVRARYSDGRVRDVTHWAKFSTTEESVAVVNEEGVVEIRGHGESAIAVWFSNLVAVGEVLVPFPHQVAEEVFARAQRNNFIDDLVLKKLKTLRIPPSPICSDAEFLRRVYLDTIGLLPTPEETQQFLADRSPDKRAKLIDRLLERPEFVDYWAYKWSDLLLISSRKLSQPAVWAFYQYVRQSVADNKPWDLFAREILTARGSNLSNGAANYFVMHRDIAELTEKTTVIFLGLSLTCARCHNHPIEKWTQDQYWAVANLFSRVAQKNGDRSGEVIVYDQASGDVPHMRRGIPMPPAPPDGVPLALDDPRNRREYFVNWLTASDNPYFARALVNRVWRHFLGRGLVEPEDDLRLTNPPTNAELFDALTREFIAHRFDVKHLIRTILNSATYQRSSQTVPENEADDRFYSHYLVRRLPAEVAIDVYSQVTEVPTPFTQIKVGTTGGVAETTQFPLGTRALQLPDSLVVSGFLDGFGRPDRSQPCSCERMSDVSMSQALHLNNGQTLNDKLRAKTGRIEKWFQEKITLDEAIRRLYLLALCREPTVQEREKIFTALGTSGQSIPSREVLEDLFWAVLTSPEFLFNH